MPAAAEYRFSTESRQEFCKRHGLDEKKKIIAMLAGNRKSEIGYLLPKMARLAPQYAECQFMLAAAPSIEDSLYEKILNRHKVENITLVRNETYPILKHSSAAIISSGTASLEAAIIGTPQVVCYGGNEISYMIARAVVKLNYISLANLILEKHIFKELIQHDCTVADIACELDRLLTDRDYIAAMKADYAKVREILGGEGASEKVARSMIDEYRKLKEK